MIVFSPKHRDRMCESSKLDESEEECEQDARADQDDGERKAPDETGEIAEFCVDGFHGIRRIMDDDTFGERFLFRLVSSRSAVA